MQTSELKDEVKKGLSALQTLRDEIRVKLHLASMDIKDQWAKLEPQLEKVEHAAGEATETSRVAVSDAVERLKKLRDSLL